MLQSCFSFDNSILFQNWFKHISILSFDKAFSKVSASYSSFNEFCWVDFLTCISACWSSSEVNSSQLLNTYRSIVLWTNLKTRAKTLQSFSYDKNLSGVNLQLPSKHQNIIAIACRFLANTLFLFVYWCWTVFLLNHSTSVVPTNSGTLNQKFEPTISFTYIPLVILSIGLNLVETYLHWEGSVFVQIPPTQFITKDLHNRLVTDRIQNFNTVCPEGDFSHIYL